MNRAWLLSKRNRIISRKKNHWSDSKSKDNKHGLENPRNLVCKLFRLGECFGETYFVLTLFSSYLRKATFRHRFFWSNMLWVFVCSSPPTCMPAAAQTSFLSLAEGSTGNVYLGEGKEAQRDLQFHTPSNYKVNIKYAQWLNGFPTWKSNINQPGHELQDQSFWSKHEREATVCLLGLTQSRSESEMSACTFFLLCEESNLLPRGGDSFRTLSHQVHLEKETICTWY